VSVQINNSAWFNNNNTVAVAEPERAMVESARFLTSKSRSRLRTRSPTARTIRFRFNRTDGVASGFRVVAFNLLTGDSSRVRAGYIYRRRSQHLTTPLNGIPARRKGTLAERRSKPARRRCSDDSCALRGLPRVRRSRSQILLFPMRRLLRAPVFMGSPISRSADSELHPRTAGPEPGAPPNPPTTGLLTGPKPTKLGFGQVCRVLDSDTASFAHISIVHHECHVSTWKFEPR
jgi:hypothetical protein